MAAGTCADMTRPAAVLFDFDGVIVDSERLHHETMVAAMAGEGPACDWTFYRDNLMGLDDRGAFALLLVRAGIEPRPEEIRRRIARKAELFSRFAAAGRVPPLPGAVDLVRACAASGPVGLCSGALRSDIEPVLTALGIAECFAARVTADDVHRSKPDPASYRLCVERLAAEFPDRGIVPAACVAIEDTVDGIVSARTAGLPVLGVANSLTAEALRAAGAGIVVDSLAGLGPEDLIPR
ncbi:MAG TPA: HAD family phosphatase [Kiritimatiellia bacterium]|nr:HAD family phosphatase [Kiritimatiellia bacterium]